MVENNIAVGIDIGLKGGISIYDINKKEFIALYKMPIVSEQGHNVLDVKELYSILNKYNIKLIVIEKISNIYGVSKSTMFSLGKQIGYITSYSIYKNIKLIEILPKTWEYYFYKGHDLEVEDISMLNDDTIYLEYCDKYDINIKKIKSFCTFYKIPPKNLEILSNYLEIPMNKITSFKLQKIKTMKCLVDIYGIDLLKKCYVRNNVYDGIVDSIMLLRYCIENNLI